MILSHIVELLLLALFSALIGFGFNKMQDPDMIFERYKDWLEYLANSKHITLKSVICNVLLVPAYKFKWVKIQRFIVFSSWYHTLRKYKFLYYLTKPLGLCIVCNTTWIGIVLTLLAMHTLSFIGGVCAICVGIASASIVIFFENLFKLIQKSI